MSKRSRKRRTSTLLRSREPMPRKATSSSRRSRAAAASPGASARHGAAPGAPDRHHDRGAGEVVQRHRLAVHGLPGDLPLGGLAVLLGQDRDGAVAGDEPLVARAELRARAGAEAQHRQQAPAGSPGRRPVDGWRGCAGRGVCSRRGVAGGFQLLGGASGGEGRAPVLHRDQVAGGLGVGDPGEPLPVEPQRGDAAQRAVALARVVRRRPCGPPGASGSPRSAAGGRRSPPRGPRRRDARRGRRRASAR